MVRVDLIFGKNVPVATVDDLVVGIKSAVVDCFNLSPKRAPLRMPSVLVRVRRSNQELDWVRDGDADIAITIPLTKNRRRLHEKATEDLWEKVNSLIPESMELAMTIDLVRRTWRRR